jgi:hypothetical protein
MSFAQWLNNNVMVFYTLFGLTIFVGLRMGVKRGGWNRHLPYMFTLLICMQYFLISPLHFYLNGKQSIIGTDITGYFGMGVFFPLIGVIFFITGYWVKKTGRQVKSIKHTEKIIRNPQKKIAIIFYIIYGVILLNMAVGGVDIQNIFIGDETLGLGQKGETYFLQNFADSLITLLILGYVYGIKGRVIILWMVLCFFLFSLLGFRYRILLSLFGLTFAYLYTHQLRAKEIIIGIIGVSVIFYFIMFITANRQKLIFKEYASLSYSPIDFEYESFFDQTRGALADMAIYKLYDNPNKDIDYDYGASMFAYIFVRMIPRVIYPDKDDFYPPPQNKIQFVAYEAWWAKSSGEAILSAGCLFIAFGWLGIVVGHFVWGYLLRAYGNGINFSDNLSKVHYIGIALVTFQWITRAYFPQTVDHAVYILAPIWILRFWSKKEKKTAGAGN